MNAVVIKQNPDHSTSEIADELHYLIDIGSKTYSVYLQGKALCNSNLDAAIPLALLAAMRLNRPLYIDGPVSASFLAGVRQVIQIYAHDFAQFHNIVVTAKIEVTPEVISTKRQAAFFSGGVDSFFTLQKHRETLTDIIYIHGFDVRLDDLPRRAAIDQMGAEIEQSTGIRYHTIASNFGEIIQDFGDWAEHGHGLALVSAARALQLHFDEVIIPGTHPIDQQKPWGSSLFTDPKFSDAQLTITHDCCTASRLGKILAIAHDPLPQKLLRVCWERVDGLYNCCHCEKCLRTMVPLELLGVLYQYTAFSLPLEPRRVASARINRKGLMPYIKKNYELCQKLGLEHTSLGQALKVQCSRPIWLAQLQTKWFRRGRRWRWLALRAIGRESPRP